MLKLPNCIAIEEVDAQKLKALKPGCRLVLEIGLGKIGISIGLDLEFERRIWMSRLKSALS